jgi:hypothetical protein
MVVAIDDSNRQEFLAVLASRQKELTTAQAARLGKVMKRIRGQDLD